MFTKLYDILRPKPWLTWLLLIATLGAGVWLASRLKLEEDVSSMLPDRQAIQAMNKAVSKSEAGEQLIFLMHWKDAGLADPDALIAAAEDYQDSLLVQCRPWIETILAQPAAGMDEALVSLIGDKLPVLLTPAEIGRPGNDVSAAQQMLQPAELNRTMAANKRLLLSPASVIYKELVAKDPAGLSALAWKKLEALRSGNSYEVYQGYLFSDSLRRLSFFIKPHYKASETGRNVAFIKALSKAHNAWLSRHPDVQATWFGGPAVAAGNAAQLRTDTIITLGATLVLLMALTLYFFRRKRTPLLLSVPVLYGAVMGLGTVALVQQHISVVALAAGAIVLGIAMDYGIHFLSHARHSQSIREAVRDLQQPLTIGSFTTIAAFYSLRLTHTPVLQDLGIFAGSTLLFAALATLIFLPQLPLGKAKVQRPTLFDRIGRWRPERNKWLVLGIVLLTPVLAWKATDVQYDSDLMHLNYMSPALEQAQAEVAAANPAALSSVFVIAEGGSRDEALTKLSGHNSSLRYLLAQQLAGSLSNPASLIPTNAQQEESIQAWQWLWSRNRIALVRDQVAAAAVANGMNPAAFDPYFEGLAAPPTVLSVEEDSVLRQLFPAGFSEDGGRHFAIAQLSVKPEHRDEVFRMLSGKKDITVTDRRQTTSQLAEVLRADFSNIALWTSLIVFLALLVGYGRIELALISFLPMAVSWVWILGLMALLGLKFNLVNIILSTLIFGLGDDYTIFTMDGLINRLKLGKDRLGETRTAIWVSMTTILIGLGVLFLAKHPALRSLAGISITGMVCVVLISQTLQPFLFNWFIQRRADKGLLPFTLWSFAKSVFAFAYFFIGSLILFVLGVLLTKLWPFGKERGRLMFHGCVSAATRSMMYIMANVRKRVHGLNHADFSRPAVYIANHTSFLDILFTTMLNPRLVLLTNRWVWRSPVFGHVVRMAEYYPVADGAEESLEPLRSLVSRGYGIIVFPEGTRSKDDRIQRFHKGAFFIAEKLSLPIVPLVLHGVGYTMRKSDWLLKDGICSMYIQQPIAPDDPRYSEGYSARAKSIRRAFTDTHQRIREAIEHPPYFREQLIRSFTYKGPSLEWYCRIKTSVERHYEGIHRVLPRHGLIYDLGCGYGFATFLLHWAAPERAFRSYDYDEDKTAAAQANFLRPETVQFAQADIVQLDLEPCEGIMLVDVLHYLLPEEQEAVLLKCAAALKPGGVLAVRDGIRENEAGLKGTKRTEQFSTKIFGFNKTRNDLHFLSLEWMQLFAAKNGLHFEVTEEGKRTSNVLMVMRKR